MYLYREYFKAKVYTIWVHGPLGIGTPEIPTLLGFSIKGLSGDMLVLVLVFACVLFLGIDINIEAWKLGARKRSAEGSKDFACRVSLHLRSL